MFGKRILLSAISGITAFTLSASAFAVSSAPYGWYLEANGGSTSITNKSYPGSSSESGIGGSAALGYKFMPYVAGEMGYTRYANTSITAANQTKAAYDRHYSYDVAVRGILPAYDTGFEAFAKLGVGRASSSVSIQNVTAANSLGMSASSHSATGLYIAAGAQYYFTPELAVVGQWARQQGSSSTGNLDLTSIGLSFIFD